MSSARRKYKVADLTVDSMQEIAASAGGWSMLRENSSAYGAAGSVAVLAHKLALQFIAPPQVGKTLGDPASVASYLSLRYLTPDQEIFGALYLDTRNRLIAEREIYRGAINRAAVEPRLILKQGLVCGAVGMIVFHTHPSGDPSPSPEDIAFTRRLAEGGEIVGVRLTDHLVIGSTGRYTSLRERGF